MADFDNFEAIEDEDQLESLVKTIHIAYE